MTKKIVPAVTHCTAIGTMRDALSTAQAPDVWTVVLREAPDRQQEAQHGFH